MPTKKIFIALRSAVFLAVPAAIAWLAGEPMIFPSLGPTAYVLAFNPEKEYTSKTVVGGHLCGVAGGLTSYYLIASPSHLDMLTESLTHPGLLLALSAVLALFLTVFLMLVFEASHPPACATTLIVSLGILSSWQQAAVILVAVVIIYLTYRLYRQWIPSFR